MEFYEASCAGVSYEAAFVKSMIPSASSLIPQGQSGGVFDILIIDSDEDIFKYIDIDSTALTKIKHMNDAANSKRCALVELISMH